MTWIRPRRLALVSALLAVGLSASTSGGEPPSYDPAAAVTRPDPPDSRNPDQEVRQLLRPGRKIFDKARKLEQRTAINRDNLKLLEDELKDRHAIVQEARQAYESADRALRTARLMMHRRLRALLQTKRIKPYAVLFGSDSFSTFLRKQRTIAKLVTKDRDRITDFERKVRHLKELETDRDRKEKWLAHRIEGMDHLRKEILTDAEVKERLLHVVDMEEAYYQELRKEIQDSDRDLRTLIREKEGDFRPLWFDKRKGQHLWPIINADIPLDGHFGRRRHPKFGTVTIQRGISMVPKGWNGRNPVRVRSVYKGHVVFAGWVSHLGWTVLIDHTKGYMSVYGHLAKAVAVKVGDRVDRGQKIGLMSDSESLWGKRLYFEIRRDGRAIDPRPFLR